MPSDLTQAFGHLEQRAEATAPDGSADRISLRDHIVTVEIGAFQQERDTTQRLRFSLVVEVAAHDGVDDDDVDKILSYDTLTEAISAELAAERLNLLETLAERIAQRVLFAPQAQRCFVRIEKLDRGPGALGVEIVRSRNEAGRSDPELLQVSPVVVYLSNAALLAPHFSGWIDDLLARNEPVILCVDVPREPTITAPTVAAQRRIDLLAIEQNAWALNGRDPRCVVVGTRTELEWAMKHGGLTVWAPSKIVLGSVDGPPADASRGAPLAAWFAHKISAQSLIVVGETSPETGDLHVLSHPIAGRYLPAS